MGKSFHPLFVFRGPDPLKQILVSWERMHILEKICPISRGLIAQKNKQTKKLFVKKSPASSVLSPESCAAFFTRAACDTATSIQSRRLRTTENSRLRPVYQTEITLLVFVLSD